MEFRDYPFKNCYESATADVVEDFYEPALSMAVKYDRIAGFFSSSSLAIAARGMGSFLLGGGMMRLICSPILSRADADSIERANGVETITLDIDNIESEFVSNHVKALGWLLQQGRLEMKLAVLTTPEGHFCSSDDVLRNGLFHQKVGILTDSVGDSISFSGSVNETATAWTRNDEEFKVFRSWRDGDWFSEDRKRFDNMWCGNRRNLRLFTVPEAVREKLINYSKDFNAESISITRYREQKARCFSFLRARISLFDYQAEALDKWKKNECSLLFEMATGSGKTRTAIAGMDWLFSTRKKILAVIACPQDTLARQWKENEVEPLGVRVDRQLIADSTNRKWESEFRNMLLDCASGFITNGIVYTTHKTLSSERFINVVREEGSGVEFLLIGDEAHWLGAGVFRNGLLEEYKYRIGLSATPSRWFDDEGTQILTNYFGNDQYEFTISDALTKFNTLTGKHFLVHYFYNIKKVELDQDETLHYKDVTRRLVKLRHIREKDDSAKTRYNRYLEERADIIKNAKAKYKVLEQLIEHLKTNNEMKNLIVFVSPQQIDTVSRILSSHGVFAHRLTENEGTKPSPDFDNISEREYIIREFKRGTYQALIAIKCLDEGIDIPDACRGILMASSTNPREYVQRIGRIIRQAPGKDFAYLYDICVESASGLDDEEKDLEKLLREKEKIRLSEIAQNSLNNSEALQVILSLGK